MMTIRRALGMAAADPSDHLASADDAVTRAAIWRRVNEQAARLRALDAQIDVQVERRRRPRI